MARITIGLPEQFQFSTDIAVRISDINYGGHLGHDSIISLMHETRVRFLNSRGFSESDIEGFGLIMTDLAVVYKAEVLYGEILTIEIGIQNITKYGWDFVYRVINKKTDKEVARAKTGVLIFDYKQKKVIVIPERFMKDFGLGKD
ncbi:MAG: thioesterase family protein [Deltaproteobacteria bacterium]|nr:thioesterase family protein [Deltaproteobacteria bacterium]